jgi:hypothetical protein
MNVDAWKIQKFERVYRNDLRDYRSSWHSCCRKKSKARKPYQMRIKKYKTRLIEGGAEAVRKASSSREGEKGREEKIKFKTCCCIK